jgi:triacylglycerol lipase
MSSSNPSRHFAFALLIPLVLAAANYASLHQQVLGFFGYHSTISSLPTVNIPQATLVGTIIDNAFPTPVEAFLGFPYAAAPTGALRFAKPVAVQPGNETFKADAFGPRCPGKQLLPPGGGEDIWSENCLTANIFRPTSLPKDQKVPVMVYIHGGAFNRGTARMHNTASMVGYATEGFIAVSFNYRIGALGFLNSKVTEQEGVLNLGLHDQVLMLEWVRDNIAAFGGDEGDVTLVGLSAGAHSVSSIQFTLVRIGSHDVVMKGESLLMQGTDWPSYHEHQFPTPIPPLPQSGDRVRWPHLTRPSPLRFCPA